MADTIDDEPTDGRSLKESVQESVNDLEAIIKSIVSYVVAKDKNGGSLKSLSDLFAKKHDEVVKTLKQVPDHQKEEEKVKNLQAIVDEHDNTIGDLQKNLMDAQETITKMVFQAGTKLKEIRQAESKRVNSETIIRFANQISKSHSITAPLDWEIGNPTRPFPTEAELRASALAAPRVSAPAAPAPLSLLRQPSTSATGVLRASGRGASPMSAYSATMQQQQRSWSPRGNFAQQSSSPRGRGARGGVISPRMMSTGFIQQRRPSTTGNSPHMPVPSYQGTKVVPPPIKNVEQMSSDSSSSSSSDEGSPS